MIGFPRGAGKKHPALCRGDRRRRGRPRNGIDREFAREQIQSRVPVQGNVDPLALLAGGAALDREVDDVLQTLGQGPLIFNLGHGILPATPIAHVERMLKRVRG